ncbi:methyltransferase domain-containing protein [Polaribacter ponticola]|uniref:Methyltransferase domain-containing protein n=1 Tax=Polaribacter ponticola TaxID=2978475 RepID=A0ABT5SBC5_9FLAO|nr:methyltransferase domain-containing protein [Polaribacter sp. MSW5]MDD7915139.1 methyltransferase domain-containing protein [Polaribacter sp. MSW5]
MQLSEDFWENKYKANKIGWDLGEVSPPLKTYFNQLTNKDIKILIPGGGNSHEAEFLFKQGFTNVYVVDVSKIPLENLKRRVPEFPDSHLIHANFFDIENKFDLIIEQTFFCAINPDLRPKYAKKMNRTLKEKGKLVGLMFDAVLNEDHPPFGGNKEEYLPYFQAFFNIEKMEPCYNSFFNRQGMELFVKMKKK